MWLYKKWIPDFSGMTEGIVSVNIRNERSYKYTPYTQYQLITVYKLIRDIIKKVTTKTHKQQHCPLRKIL